LSMLLTHSLCGSTSIVPGRHQIFIFRRASSVKTRPGALLEINHADKAIWVRAAGLHGNVGNRQSSPVAGTCSSTSRPTTACLPLSRRTSVIRLAHRYDVRLGTSSFSRPCHRLESDPAAIGDASYYTYQLPKRSRLGLARAAHNADRRQCANFVPYWLKSVYVVDLFFCQSQ